MAESFIKTALLLYHDQLAKDRDVLPQLPGEGYEVVYDPQDLVFAFVTAARQGVELLLKTLILCRCRLDQDDSLFVTGHKLEELWQAAKPIFDVLDDPADRTADLQALVRGLSQLDPKGTDYRYPADLQLTDISKSMHGVFVGGVLAIPFLNLSAIARHLRTVMVLVHTCEMVDEHLEAEAGMAE